MREGTKFRPSHLWILEAPKRRNLNFGRLISCDHVGSCDRAGDEQAHSIYKLPSGSEDGVLLGPAVQVVSPLNSNWAEDRTPLTSFVLGDS